MLLMYRLCVCQRRLIKKLIDWLIDWIRAYLDLPSVVCVVLPKGEFSLLFTLFTVGVCVYCCVLKRVAWRSCECVEWFDTSCSGVLAAGTAGETHRWTNQTAQVTTLTCCLIHCCYVLRCRSDVWWTYWLTARRQCTCTQLFTTQCITSNNSRCADSVVDCCSSGQYTCSVLVLSVQGSVINIPVVSWCSVYKIV